MTDHPRVPMFRCPDCRHLDVRHDGPTGCTLCACTGRLAEASPTGHAPLLPIRVGSEADALVVMRLRALVTDWPTDQVPMVPIERLAEILEGQA